MTKHQPYTYLIGWSKQNLFYYGVRFSSSCQPEDLWTKYFTSSRYVTEARIKLGEPDIKEVRKVFKHKDDAIKWESKVLRRLGAHRHEKFLNKTNNKSINNSPQHYQSLADQLRGKPRSTALKGKLSRAVTKKRRQQARLIFQQTSYRRVYNVTMPDGTIIVVDDLKPFCFKHNLSYTSMSSLANDKYPCSTYKGFKIVKVGCRGVER